MKPALALLLAASALSATHGQDSLFYANGRAITGQVEEIGASTVRYRTQGAGEVVVTAEKSELARIRLANGQEFLFRAPLSPKDIAARRRINAIGLDLFAPALNHLSVGYERLIGERISLVARAGWIGLQQSLDQSELRSSSGGLGRLGVKFIMPRAERGLRSARGLHPLAGWYLRLEIAYSAWERRWRNDIWPYPVLWEPEEHRTRYASGSLNLLFGGQALLGDRVAIDAHAGLGYGLQWVDGEPANRDSRSFNRQAYAFSHLFLGDYTILTACGGVMVSYLF